MKKTKADFIGDFLKHKKMNIRSKDRAFSLTVHEIDKLENTAVEIHKELINLRDNAFQNKSHNNRHTPSGNIEENINISSTNLSSGHHALSTEIINNKEDGVGDNAKKIEIANPDNENVASYVNPRNTAKFLLAYNQNIILKSTTHNIDSNRILSINEFLGIKIYSFELHLKAIQNTFSALYDQYKPINHSLWGKISAYLFGNRAWSVNNISHSWASPDLKKWAGLNPGLCPNPESDIHSEPYNFGRVKLPNGTSIKNQCELVLYFKDQITIRSSNSLFDLCSEWNFKFKDKVDFDLSSMPKNIEFFTDVEKLQQAYTKIVGLFIECSGGGNKPIISLTLSENVRNKENVIVFSIKHKNSIYLRTINSTISRYGKTFTELIKNQINGLCDWEVSAEFEGNQFGKVSIWPSKKEYIALTFFEGVQYDLIFYK